MFMLALANLHLEEKLQNLVDVRMSVPVR